MHLKTTITSLVISFALAAPVAAGGGDKHDDKKADKRQAGTQRIKEKISDWPQSSREAAQAALEQYGEPDGVTDSMLVWRDNDPWKKTVVTSEPVEHNFPFPHEDVIYQTVEYDVPVEKISDIAEFDGSVSVQRTEGTMTAGCASEGGNKLALNLARQVADGEISVDEARQASADAMEETLAGNPPQNVRQLAFNVPDDTADPDEAVLQVAGR